MRFYRVVIQNSSGQIVRTLSSTAQNATYSSVDDNGKPIPGALRVELDAMVYNLAAPAGGSSVRIWGVSIQEISQAQNFNNLSIAVYGGMTAGLPLENPSQQGLLLQGTIQQAFGNWQGTTMTLDFVIQPGWGSIGDPVNLNGTWLAGTPISDMLTTVLGQAFPGQQIKITTNQNVVAPADLPFTATSLTQFSQWVFRTSRAIIQGNYPGIQIAPNGGNLIVYDDTAPSDATNSPSSPKVLDFKDLIGQPTWIEFNVVSMKLVLRGDLALGMFIQMPPSLVTTTPQSFSQYRQSSIFQNSSTPFQIRLLRHIGDSRQPDASAWGTVVEAYQLLAA